MLRLAPVLVLASLLAGAAPVRAAGADPARQAVEAYVSGTSLPCTTLQGEASCTIAGMAAGRPATFYGKAADGADEAVAFVSYQADRTGNAMDLMAVVFRLDGGRWVPVGRVEGIQGGDPRDVRFDPEGIRYVGTILGPCDDRAEPTGEAAFRLRVEGDAVTFARLDGADAR